MYTADDKEANKEEAMGCFNRSLEAAETMDWDTALCEIDSAIKLRPGKSKYLTAKARILREMKRLKESEEVLREAIGVNPESLCAWIEAGLLYQEQEFFEKAAFCYKQCVDIKQDYNIYTLLANMELAFDPKSALIHAESALELEPTWEEAIKVREAAKREIARLRESGDAEVNDKIGE